jgi:hypothetical protein
MYPSKLIATRYRILRTGASRTAVTTQRRDYASGLRNPAREISLRARRLPSKRPGTWHLARVALRNISNGTLCR